MAVCFKIKCSRMENAERQTAPIKQRSEFCVTNSEFVIVMKKVQNYCQRFRIEKNYLSKILGTALAIPSGSVKISFNSPSLWSNPATLNAK